MATKRGGQQRIPRPPEFRLGPPPPWNELPPARRSFSLDEVRARLAALPPAREPVARAEGSRAAAVLMPLYERDGEAHVVLIKRPEEMPTHKGEIAFPGGGFDPRADTSLQDTALREACEEVGLRADDVEVVSQLDGLGTVASRFTITPFVGFLPDPPALVPNPREVVRILEVPLAELLDPEAYRNELWDAWMEDLSIHFYDLDDETIWGATARILTTFLAHLTEAR